jgi:glutamate carboxypeptidase
MIRECPSIRRRVGALFSLSVAVFSTLPGQPVAGQQVSPAEAAVVRAIDERADQAVALLERLVNVNSGTMNFEGVREVGRILAAELEAIGFAVELTDGSAFDRAGHLVARNMPADATGPHLLLIGHLDTVFEPGSPFQTFTMTSDSTATGPGVVDMKGGDVVIVEAMRALRAAGELDNLRVTIVMTGDEEASGRPLDLSKAALIEAAEAADIAIAFENGDSNPRTAVVARRGSTGWRLDVKGTPAHSSQLFQPEVGSGAIYETARILTEWHRALAGEPNLTFNPGVIVGGTTAEYDAFESAGSAFGKSNVVAETTTVTGDLRAISIDQLERTRARMAFIAGQNLPGTSAIVTFDDGYPPLAPTDGNYRMLELFDRVSRDLGFGPVTAVNPRNAGAADVSFTAGLVDMAIDGLGPGGGKDHTVDEWIILPTLAMQAKRAAVMIMRLGRPAAS